MKIYQLKVVSPHDMNKILKGRKKYYVEILKHQIAFLENKKQQTEMSNNASMQVFTGWSNQRYVVAITRTYINFNKPKRKHK